MANKDDNKIKSDPSREKNDKKEDKKETKKEDKKEVKKEVKKEAKKEDKKEDEKEDKKEVKKETKKEDKKDKNSKNENKPNECPICLDKITNLCRTDPCNHEFCLQCLDNWTQEHNCCPVCRQVFDRIIYNIRSDSLFDAMRVNNRETRVRRLLLAQRDSLRRNLNRLRTRNDRQIEQLRRRLEAREAIRNRINDGITRIDAINRQNNGQIDSTLNDIRNTINEINYHNFADNTSLVSLTAPEGQSLNPEVNELPQILLQNLIPNSNSAVMVPIDVESEPNGETQDISDESNPRVMEWDIVGPNSSERVRVSSSQSPDGNAVTQRSVIVSEYPNQQMASNEQNDSFFSPFGQIFEDVNNPFREMENHMNRVFDQMVQNFNFGFTGSFGPPIHEHNGPLLSLPTSGNSSNRRQTSHRGRHSAHNQSSNNRNRNQRNNFVRHRHRGRRHDYEHPG